jgi:salicylate hydroxylase
MSRILRHLELLDQVRLHAISFDALSLRRYADDSELGHVPKFDVEKTYGAPILVIHRGDLQQILKAKAETVGAQILLAALLMMLILKIPVSKLKMIQIGFREM